MAMRTRQKETEPFSERMPPPDLVSRRQTLLTRLGRYATSTRRALPDFIVIGAQSSGTTSLFHYLRRHPLITPASKKEVHYFDTHFRRRLWWYRSHFPIRERLSRTGHITGEASPSYLAHPWVAARIHDCVPDVKLVALLRNPVTRAVSSYRHQVMAGREKLPLAEALAAEERRTAPAYRKILSTPRHGRKVSRKFRRFSYRRRGLYADLLEEYLSRFSRDQLFVECSENFFRDPNRTMKKLCAFLEIDDSFICNDLPIRNKGTCPVDVSEQTYRALEEFYAPHNARLFELIGKEFDW